MAEPDYRCPKCGGANFKRWQLPHLTTLHWIINPGLVINEIVLGQRVPKIQLICKDCEGSAMDRAYIPCPSCQTLHAGKHWSRKRAFGNWRGIGCPTCSESIPCLWNLFSLLVLAVTSPIWALPYFLHFRKKPVRPIYDPEGGPPPPPEPPTRKVWIKMGVGWGTAMWVLLAVLPALATMRDGGIDWPRILIGIPMWTIAGLAFGFAMWFLLGRKKTVAAVENE